MVCTSSNKFLLGVIVKYCQFPRHKCFLLQNLLTKKLHNCGHFGQCTVLHIDYLYRQGQKWSIIWWLVATHSLSQAVYTANVYGGLQDVHRFSLQYWWKRDVLKNLRETLYFSKWKIIYVVGHSSYNTIVLYWVALVQVPVFACVREVLRGRGIIHAHAAG